MITPFDLFVSIVVTFIGCGVISNVCIWICDQWCRVPTTDVVAGTFPDLLIVLIFSLGPVCTLPAYWLVFVVITNGHYWW